MTSKVFDSIQRRPRSLVPLGDRETENFRAKYNARTHDVVAFVNRESGGESGVAVFKQLINLLGGENVVNLAQKEEPAATLAELAFFVVSHAECAASSSSFSSAGGLNVEREILEQHALSRFDENRDAFTIRDLRTAGSSTTPAQWLIKNHDLAVFEDALEQEDDDAALSISTASSVELNSSTDAVSPTSDETAPPSMASTEATRVTPIPASRRPSDSSLAALSASSPASPIRPSRISMHRSSTPTSSKREAHTRSPSRPRLSASTDYRWDAQKDTLDQHTSVRPFRFLVCGGDGTVTWLLNEISQFPALANVPVAICPLGTGNDLARSLGWGKGLQRIQDLGRYIENTMLADVVSLDRWKLEVVPDGALPDDHPFLEVGNCAPKQLPISSPSPRDHRLGPRADPPKNDVNVFAAGTGTGSSRGRKQRRSTSDAISESATSTMTTTTTSSTRASSIASYRKREGAQVARPSTSPVNKSATATSSTRLDLSSSSSTCSAIWKPPKFVGYFQCYFSIGLDAEISYRVERSRKQTRIGRSFFRAGLGKCCYGWQGFAHVGCFQRNFCFNSTLLTPDVHILPFENVVNAGCQEKQEASISRSAEKNLNNKSDQTASLSTSRSMSNPSMIFRRGSGNASPSSACSDVVVLDEKTLDNMRKQAGEVDEEACSQMQVFEPLASRKVQDCLLRGRVRQLTLVNINSYGAGSVPVAPDVQDPGDGLLEFCAVRNPFFDTALFCGFARMHFLEQVPCLKLRVDKGVYMQYDGEAWHLPTACTLMIRKDGTLPMLRAPKSANQWNHRQGHHFWNPSSHCD
ncbi:unnamed protein product [Amoebophrya sp. A25]|nr:unnamed protein product [Amoebophrya sp. A25]|eukprot:GSA25T00000294001.1